MLQHTGLDDAQLGPRLARLLAPSSPLPAREMVARGLAPLAGAEPWLALYQLWVRGGATLADQASRTASDLPLAAVMTALADPHLPAVVLDFIARRKIHSPEILRLVVHHPRVHDASLRLLARCAPEGVCGAVARNQRRWLACPAIAEQLLRNPCCDRATAHAVLELGAREAVPGLAELRSLTLAGAVLQDSPEAHARAIAWMLRSGPADVFPELGAASSTRRALPGEAEALPAPGSPRSLSLRPGPPAPRSTPPIGLSLRPAHAEDPPGAIATAPARPRDLAFARGLSPPDELDELDLPIADDWDELDPDEVPPPAPRGPAARPHWTPPAPDGPAPPPAPRSPRPGTAHPHSHTERLELVLDPNTPLTLAMSQLHRLPLPDLRRVAAARRLPSALVAAARRRVGGR